MKNLLLFFLLSLSTHLGISQSTSNNYFWRNVEIYYSPFQTRIGGFEYDINRINEEGDVDTRTKASFLSTNDFEFGLNYLFKIKKANLGIGLSYYSDSYNYSVYASITNRLYKIDMKGVSINLFFRKELSPNTTLDLGLNTRIRTNYKSNRNNYSDNELISSFNITYNERWSGINAFQLIPSLQFNTEIYKGFFIRYGLLAKFWGQDFYSIMANKKSGNQESLLDFKANSSVFKGTISIGYKFSN